MNSVATRICIGLTVASIGLVHSAQAATNAWFASSGLLPNQTTTNWVLSDTAIANPTLSGGVMTLSTGASSEQMNYRQTSNLAIPSNWTIEFRARFDSRNSTANNNSAMCVFFTTANSVGNILYMRQDDIWLANGFLVRGNSAAVDTDDAFHTYRIELSGTSSGSAVNVFYDNGALPILTHQLVTDFNLNFGVQRIGFGDGTAGDSGVSEWEYLWHNGSSVSIVPEPSSLALLGCASAVFLATRRKD